MEALKPETIAKIREVLNFDVNERKDRMLHIIENGYDGGLYARIAEYRAAFTAAKNFDTWATDEDEKHEEVYRSNAGAGVPDAGGLRRKRADRNEELGGTCLEKINSSSAADIIRHNETGVCYVWRKIGSVGGMTLMVNPDGSPYVWKAD